MTTGLCAVIERFFSQLQRFTMAVSFGTVLVAVIAVTAAIIYRQFTEIPCQENEEIRLKGFFSSFDESRQANIPIPLCQVFSDDYEQAKRRFLQALEGLNHEIYSIPVAGETYTMDIAVLPGTPDNTGLVVHTSGVHGIEGYAGSAIQLAFLRALAEDKDADSSSSSSRPTVILVHAFNPYGMAHYRRVNENNVDLNRNALRPDDWKRAEHHPNKENYDRFNHAFNPTKAPTWFYGYVQYWLESLPLIAIHGLPTLKAALVVGQHHRPTSVFFNGQKVEASIVKLEDWLTGYFQSRPNKFAGVTWIDVHTGLGAFGEDTILPAGFTSEDTLEHLRQQLEQWYPDSHHPASSKVGATVSKGYEGVKFVADYFSTLFDEDQEPLLTMQEFGTLHNILVARALVMENAAYHHASDPSQALEWAKRVLRPAFCPSYPQWRRAIVQRGVAVLYQSMKRSLHYSSSSSSFSDHPSVLPDQETNAEMSHDTAEEGSSDH